ncbi:glucokinase [Synechococcus sp. UW105]|uniref:glucokinase n=1 Tax=Synechococcus sp. UW105 TaxID=337067 RepID=UPI000E0F89EB|nr:glucokinase [Synechococcus sp. UW105]
MAANTFLAGDVGGTKTLLALYGQREGQLQALYSQRYRSGEWSCLEGIVHHFLSSLPADLPRPKTSCLAVAGPVQNGTATLTNLPWVLSETLLCDATGLKHLELVNDFAVLIHGLPHLDDQQQVVLQGGHPSRSATLTQGGAVAVVGAGTGLGMARGIPGPHGWLAVASEGGHREFAARTEDEWQLASWLKADLDLDRLSVERIVSGTGLGHVMRWRLQQPDAVGHPLQRAAEAWRSQPVDSKAYQDLPALTDQASQSGDPLARQALDLWLGAYGSAAGDLALQELCSGGLWIGGGTAAKHLKGLQSATFLEPMRSKGRFRAFIDGLRVHAVIDANAGRFSAACRARDLATEIEST